MQFKVTIQRDAPGKFTLRSHESLEALNPKELFLYSTLLCSAYTIDSLLEKKRIELPELELTLSGHLTTPTLQAESIFDSFFISYNALCSSLEDQAGVAQAIRLSHDKYCGLLQMLRKIAPLSHEIALRS